MSERAKILGLPKNEVLKPVLLTKAERDVIRAALLHFVRDEGQDVQEKTFPLINKF